MTSHTDGCPIYLASAYIKICLLATSHTLVFFQWQIAPTRNILITEFSKFLSIVLILILCFVLNIIDGHAGLPTSEINKN